ncbi:MAG: biopolymer transporter ExbD [Kiritimatiellae bacterium]|jgi:biopolymer transport protein ExbD|nr:biopolymer transporter ExbD [Kiritimatiellia bacterium]
MAIRRRKKPSLVLPLSSMGDIAFLLIIFFMLASNFMKTGNVELEKPGAPQLEQQEAPKCSVLMDKDALIWYEGAQSSKDEVMGALKELVGKNRDFLVHVSIDKELKKKDFMPLIEAISESGAKMVLTGEPED